MAGSNRFLRRSAGAAAVAGLLLSTLVACGPGSGSSSESGGLSTFRTTVAPGLGSLPFQVAKTKDYFKECGVKLEVTQGYDIPSYLAAIGRQFDSVMLVPSLSVPAAAAGLDLRAFGGMEGATASYSPNRVVTNNPDVHSIEDLVKMKGKIGVVAAGDDYTAYFKTLFKGTDMSPADITQVTVPFSDMPDQLKAGRIDAFIGAAGFYEFLLSDPKYRVIANFPTDVVKAAGVTAPTNWAHFVTTAEYAKDHKNELKCFNNSLHKAEDWISANKTAAFGIYADWIGAKPGDLKDAVMPEWQDVNVETYEAWQTILGNNGMLQNPIEPSKIVLDLR